MKRMLRRLSDQRCQYPGCLSPATEYDAALDARTCTFHQDLPDVERSGSGTKGRLLAEPVLGLDSTRPR
jgi:hypothetical protein